MSLLSQSNIKTAIVAAVTVLVIFQVSLLRTNIVEALSRVVTQDAPPAVTPEQTCEPAKVDDTKPDRTVINTSHFQKFRQHGTQQFTPLGQTDRFKLQRGSLIREFYLRLRGSLAGGGEEPQGVVEPGR